MLQAGCGSARPQVPRLPVRASYLGSDPYLPYLLKLVGDDGRINSQTKLQLAANESHHIQIWQVQVLFLLA